MCHVGNDWIWPWAILPPRVGRGLWWLQRAYLTWKGIFFLQTGLKSVNGHNKIEGSKSQVIAVPAAGAIYFAKIGLTYGFWYLGHMKVKNPFLTKFWWSEPMMCNTRILKEIGFWPSYDLKIKIHGSNLLAMTGKINLRCGSICISLELLWGLSIKGFTYLSPMVMQFWVKQKRHIFWRQDSNLLRDIIRQMVINWNYLAYTISIGNLQQEHHTMTCLLISMRMYKSWFSNYRPQSEGDNVIGSVCPSLCLSVHESICNKGCSLPVRGFCPCVGNQGAYANNLADVVDRLVILITPKSFERTVIKLMYGEWCINLKKSILH